MEIFNDASPPVIVLLGPVDLCQAIEVLLSIDAPDLNNARCAVSPVNRREVPFHLARYLILRNHMDGRIPLVIDKTLFRDPSTLEKPLISCPSEPF